MSLPGDARYDTDPQPEPEHVTRIESVCDELERSFEIAQAAHNVLDDDTASDEAKYLAIKSLERIGTGKHALQTIRDSATRLQEEIQTLQQHG